MAFLAALVAILSAAAVVTGAVVTYFLRRRGSTGRVSTSDAATLWKQSQEMYAQVLQAKVRAEEQRDRLIATQASQLVTVLSQTDESLRQILVVLKDNQNTLEEVSRRLGGGGP